MEQNNTQSTSSFNSTPNVINNANTVSNPKKSNTTLLIWILLVCVFILLLLLTYYYLTQTSPKPVSVITDVTTSSVNSNENTNTSVTSTNSSTKALEFSTFSNEYITFRYPKGWKVELNDPEWMDYSNECSNPMEGFKGVSIIKLIRQNTENPSEVQQIVLAVDNPLLCEDSVFTYTFNEPKRLAHQRLSDMETLSFDTAPRLISSTTGGKYFYGETSSNMSPIRIFQYVPQEDVSDKDLTFSIPGVTCFSTLYPSQDKILDIFKYEGKFNCSESEGISLVSLYDYDSINDTPENVANILDTFISSIVSKK